VLPSKLNGSRSAGADGTPVLELLGAELEATGAGAAFFPQPSASPTDKSTAPRSTRL
jgi:hypothetical protein